MVTVQQIGMLAEPLRGPLEVGFVNLDADAVSSSLPGRQAGSARPQEGVKNRITNEAEHANKAACKFERERCRVISSRSAWDIGPNLAEPSLV